MTFRLFSLLIFLCIATGIAVCPGGILPVEAGEALRGRTIVIDPGHGGADPGAVDLKNGVLEKTINLDVAHLLAERLRREGARVVMTWEEESAFCHTGPDGPFLGYMSLEERALVANRNRADLVISIHANSFRDERCFGPEVFYHTDSSAGRRLAGYLERRLTALREIAGVKVRSSTYRLLCQTSMPAVIVEMGYITNARERRLLLEPTYQQKLADAFHQAINDYFARKARRSTR